MKKTQPTKFAVVIPTYKRSDGKTPYFLKRALSSIENQKYNSKDIHVFIIGDKYEDEEEFKEIYDYCTSFRFNATFLNLKEAVERDANYPAMALWSYGGVNATNFGIEQALKSGFKWICHLDHDDYWKENHLSEIDFAIKAFDPSFVYTVSTYKGSFLPIVNTREKHLLRWPEAYKLIHSATCINFEKIELGYRDIFKETGQVGIPSDADLWNRINEYMLKNGMKSILITEQTCFHEEEGFEQNNK